jgi:hypothetical protein
MQTNTARALGLLALMLVGVGIGTVANIPGLRNEQIVRVPGPVRQGTLDSRIPPEACPSRITPDSIKCEVNAIRRANGLPLLKTNYRLRRAARGHAKDMVARGYFAHVSPDGGSLEGRVRSAGFFRGARDWGLGEDIGWGTGSLSTPREIVAAWMRSPPHRAVILSRDYKEGGAGIAQGTPQGADGYTYVMDLGFRSRRPSAAGWEDRPR